MFWKQPPHFRELFAITSASDIMIVPVMTASGYYSNTVLPREIERGAARIEPVNLRIAQPIGELPGMTDIIIEQAVAASAEAGIEAGEAHLLLIGHGTRRDPLRSGATTYRHAAQIKTRSIFQAVSAGFLEQDPQVDDAFAAIPGSEPVIVVPFLIANGGHGADDIPGALGLKPGLRVAIVDGRPVLFADAVGEHPRVVNLILQSAEIARAADTKVA